jgi:DNA (cytosine-5)-methyltransferase 1
MRPLRALDLFCGSGAVSIGLRRAGFDVVGVDLARMPRYEGAFLQADALALDVRFLRWFDFIWASPMCQKHTRLKHAKHAKVHVDQIPDTRKLLKAAGVPYVIENVVGAPLIDPIILNGFMFGLTTTTSDGTVFHLERERQFEASWPLAAPTDWTPKTPVIGVYGGHVRNRSAAHGGRKTADFPGEDKPRLMRECMGLAGENQTMKDMSQAIPPAYAEWIGRQAITHIRGAAVDKAMWGRVFGDV